MGAAQAAQREEKSDSAAEEGGKVSDAPAEQHVEDQPLKKNRKISEISGKAGDTGAEANRGREDEAAAEANVSPDKVSEAEKEETPLKDAGINEKDSPNEADAEEDDTLDTIEMDAKNNDINESFRRLFSNINLKVTVKRGSAERDDIAANVSDDVAEEEPNRLDGIHDDEKENKSEDVENNTSLITAPETYGHDSTSPALTDFTSEEVLEKTEEGTTETKDDASSENADSTITGPVGGDQSVQQHPSMSEEELVVSPVKRFFKTGIFSGLRKKKKSVDETTEKELVDMRKIEAETEKPAEQEQVKDKETRVGTETVNVQTEHKETEVKQEVVSAATTGEGISTSTDPSAVINESEITSSQEKDKVPASPLKRLLSGSSFRKPAKKQRERKSSEAKLSDSGEHDSNQVPPSTEAPDNQKEGSPVGEEEGAWASFKKLMTPKKRLKRSSLTNDETQTPNLVQESKSSEGEQMSDNSTEDSKRRKDSSVSWEAVLCGSGRRRSRSRKTSDSEDEKPQEESESQKQESPLESSNEVDKTLTSHPKQEGSASEGDGGSTWKSFKKLVTPKRKAKDEEIQSDGEVTQDDSSSLIKKLLPGQKKRRPAERQDYASSDEADKEITSGDDEDSETPAVVPLSEFDTEETGVHLQTHADIESQLTKEADAELPEDRDKMPEPAQLRDDLQSEEKIVEGNEETLKVEESPSPISNQEPDEITELISKHQQLSDIPEEGVFTETMVTPGSVAEQPARDDTIADDLIEITSEAITAPEPVDATLGDDTEMISAVSQLSDSSKTSGNTTPVPVEYTVKDTEVLLQQVAENISLSPKADPLCSDEISSERIVASVSCQILENFVKQQPTVLEIHRRSDATSFKTGLNVKEMDAIDELAATAQTERVGEFNEAVSTEMVSGDPSELDAAESSVDETYEVRVTQTEKSMELENTNESQSEYEPACTEILSEQGFLVAAHQVKAQVLESIIQEEESLEQEVQASETEDVIMQQVTGQVQVELQEQSSEGMQEIAAEETLNLEKGENRAAEDVPDKTVTLEPKDVEEPEKEDKAALLEDIPPAEAVADEAQGPMEPFPEVHAFAEKEVELQTDAAEAEHDQMSEVSAVPEASGEKVEVPILESIQGEEEDQCKEEAEPEKKEQQADAAKAEDGPVLEGLDVQDATTELQMSGIQIPEKEELLSEGIKPVIVKHEPKGQPESLNGLKVDLGKTDEEDKDFVKNEDNQVPEVLVVHESDLESTTENIKTLEKEKTAETFTDEPKGQTLGQVDDEEEKEDEPEAEAAKTEQSLEKLEQGTEVISQIGSFQMSERELTFSEDNKPEEEPEEPKEETKPLIDIHIEPEKKEKPQTDSDKAEHDQVPEALASQESDFESSILKTHESKVPVSENTTETSTEKPEGQPELLTQANVEQEKKDETQVDDSKTEESPEKIVEKQATVLISEIGNIQMTEKDITEEPEEVSEEPKEKTEPLIEVDAERANEDKLLAEETESEKAALDEPKNKAELQAEVHEEPEKKNAEEESDAVPEVSVVLKKKEQADPDKTEQVSELILEEQATAVISQKGSIQMPQEEETLSKEMKPEEVSDEPEEKTEPFIKVDDEPEHEDKLLAGETESENAASDEPKNKTELGAEVHEEPKKEDESQPEDIKTQMDVSDEPKEELEAFTEVSVDLKTKEPQADPDKTEQVISEILLEEEDTALISQIGTIQMPEEEETLSKEMKPEEVSDEPEEKTEPLSKVDAEPEHEDKLLAGETESENAASDEPKNKRELRAEIYEEPEKEDESQPEDIKTQMDVSDEPKEELEAFTEVRVDLKTKEPQADPDKTEQVISEILLEEQDTALISQIGTIQMPEEEETLSKEMKPEEVSDEPEEKTEIVKEVYDETTRKQELQTQAIKSEHDPDPHLLDKLKNAPVLVLESVETAVFKVPSQEDILPEVPELEEKKPTEVDIEPEKNENVLEQEYKAENEAPEEPKKETKPQDEGHLEPEQDDKSPDEGIKSQKEVTEELETVTEVTVELKTEPEVQPKDLTKVYPELQKEDEVQAETLEASEEVASILQTDVEIKSEQGDKDELQEELEPGHEGTSIEPQEKDELQEDATNAEQAQGSEIMEEHATALVSQIHSVQMPEKNLPSSANIQLETAVKDKITEKSDSVAEVKSAEMEKEDERHEDVQTENTQLPVAVPETAIDSEKVTPEMSEAIQPTETETASKETTERTEAIESAIKESLLDTHMMDHHGSKLDLESSQVQTSDEEKGSLVEKVPLPDDSLETEEEKEHLTEVEAESIDTPKTEHQEPEVLEASQLAQVLDEGTAVPELTSTESETPKVEEEPIQATEGYNEPKEDQAARVVATECLQVSDILPCDVLDGIVTKTQSENEGPLSGNIKENIKELTQKSEQPQLIDSPSPDTDSVIASAPDKTEGEAVDLEVNKAQAIEIIPEDVQVQEENRIPEVVDNLQTLSAVHVSSVTEERSRAHVLEKKVISEKTASSDKTTVTDEPKYEVHLNEVQEQAEREKEAEFGGPEVKTSRVEHAVVAQVILCNLKEVTTAIPEVLIEKPSKGHEPFIDMMVSELEFRKEAEVATLLATNDVTDTATESSVVMTMHAPSAESEKNHNIQVQVVDVDVKSAEMYLDSVLEVCVTEAKEVIDVCHETIKVVDQLSAAEETEELIKEENKRINHQILQHVKASLPESVVVQTSTPIEQDPIEQTHVTEETEVVESKLDGVEDPRPMEVCYITISQKQDATTTVLRDDATTDDKRQTPTVKVLSIHDHEEDLEQLKTFGAGVTTEGIKLSPEELELKRRNEEAQSTKSPLSQTLTVGNTGLEIPQNAGVISSIGNVESPSSLSLEFKLNIQFGQAKVPASPPAAAERTDPLTPTHVSDVGIQAVEPLALINGAHENKKKPEMHDVTVQATELNTPECANLDTAERAVIMKRPVLLDFGIQSVEAAQPVEQTHSMEKLIPRVPETEKTKPVMQAESFSSQRVLYEACYEEIRVEEPVKQIEEENDQDLWVDAEEEIQTQEEPVKPLMRVEKRASTQVKSDKEGKLGPDCEFEMAPETTPKSKTKKEESQSEMYKMGEMCDIENEADEFAVALEHPEIATSATKE